MIRTVFISLFSVRKRISKQMMDSFQCAHDDRTGVGITQIKLVCHNRRQLCVVARLAGFLEFLEISTPKNKDSKNFMQTSNTILANPEMKTSPNFVPCSSAQKGFNTSSGVARRCKLVQFKICHEYKGLYLC